jgi:hypothetical protein
MLGLVLAQAMLLENLNKYKKNKRQAALFIEEEIGDMYVFCVEVTMKFLFDEFIVSHCKFT